MGIKQTKIYRFFSSIKLAIRLLVIITILSLVGTLIPQNEEPLFYITKYGHVGYNFLSKIGLIDIYSAWWFILFIILLSVNLIFCLLNRFSLKLRLLGTLISHLSILVILAGALVGMFYGEKGYIQIKEGESINSFVSRRKSVVLDFSIRLDDFIYEEYISPEEKLLVYSKDAILLLDVSAEIGNEAEIKDTSYRVKILRFVPDFSMDISTGEVVSKSNKPQNPAIEVELKRNNSSAKTFWVFARYPDIHQKIEKDFKFVYNWAARRPKDFISKVTVIKDAKEVMKKDIKVNFPLKFEGYTFFQSSYDKENLRWSGLQVVHDPGVPIVYLGFALLILGLCIIFYINPLMQRRK